MNIKQVDEYRRKNKITVDGMDVPKPMRVLDDVQLPDSVLKVLKDHSYALKPIHAQGWPMILNKRQDFIGIVETRVGLALTYLLPALIYVKRQSGLVAKDEPIALILAPTPERVLQIQTEASKFVSLKINIATLCGDVSQDTQTLDLQEGVQIIIATLEGLDNMLKCHKTNLKGVTYLVFDELDVMLDKGFWVQIHKLIGQIRRDCRILLWSLTRSKGVEQLAFEYLNDPYKMTIGSPEANPTGHSSKERLTQFKKNFLLESQSVAMTRSEDIVVEGKNVLKPIEELEDVGFPDYVMKFLRGAKPTPIQARVWPMALKGRDFIAIGETCPEKTLSFLLPAIVHLKDQPASEDGPIALILAPTSEHFLQIQEEATKFGVKIVCLYGGGFPKGPQILDLQKGVEILIATPEILIFMLDRHYTYLHRVTYLVLDEADVMLDMGFKSKIHRLIGQIRRDCQLLYWIENWSKDVEKLEQLYMCNPYKVTISSPNLEAKHAIYQKVEVVNDNQKFDKLVELLRKIMGGTRTLIFIKTEKECDQISMKLCVNGWPALNINGGKNQAERDFVISQFRECKSPIMITTDDAALHLGKEINVTHVINYDFPGSLEIYKDRIKRAGAKGKSYTFFTSGDAKFAKGLVNILGEAGQEVSEKLVNI